MQDPQYYGLGESRFSTTQQGASKGDPYYYELAEAPNMLGARNPAQPWSMQNGAQPSFMSSNMQPNSVSSNPYSLGYASGPEGQKMSMPGSDLGYASGPEGQKMLMPGSGLGYASGPEGQRVQSLGFGVDANGNRVQSLGGEPIVSSADYQGRKFANELGEITNSKVSMIPCVIVCAAVSGLVAYIVSKR